MKSIFLTFILLFSLQGHAQSFAPAGPVSWLFEGCYKYEFIDDWQGETAYFMSKKMVVDKSAGKNADFCYGPKGFFRPEVGDEVVMSFVYDRTIDFELMANVSKATGITVDDAEDFYNQLGVSLRKLSKSEPLQLVGFGSFSVSKVKGGQAYDVQISLDPSSAEDLKIKGMLVPKVVALPKSLILDLSIGLNNGNVSLIAKVTSQMLGQLMAHNLQLDYVNQSGETHFYENGNKAAGFLSATTF